jgi:hypothetical protein
MVTLPTSVVLPVLFLMVPTLKKPCLGRNESVIPRRDALEGDPATSGIAGNKAHGAAVNYDRSVRLTPGSRPTSSGVFLGNYAQSLAAFVYG